MSTTVTLDMSNSVTLDANGNGTAKLGPAGAAETWQVANVHVKTNQAPGSITHEATCYVYAGTSADDTAFADSTFTGSSGDTTDAAAAVPLTVGEWIWAVWHGGDPGAQGIVRVSGSRVI